MYVLDENAIGRGRTRTTPFRRLIFGVSLLLYSVHLDHSRVAHCIALQGNNARTTNEPMEVGMYRFSYRS